MNPDDPGPELFKLRLLKMATKALRVVDALQRAYHERTGLEGTPESEYTVGDMKRASRILRSERDPK